MSNRFFQEDDLGPDTKMGWRSLLSEELRRRNPFGDLFSAANYSAPEITIYHKDYYRPYGARLVLQMVDSGLDVGFSVERGYVFAANSGWTVQAHWDWHHFLDLIGNDPAMQWHFIKARQQNPGFSVHARSSPSDNERILFSASHLPLAVMSGLLNSWPGHLWCEFLFSSRIDRRRLIQLADEDVVREIIDHLSAVEPIYRLIVHRKILAITPASRATVSNESA